MEAWYPVEASSREGERRRRFRPARREEAAVSKRMKRVLRVGVGMYAVGFVEVEVGVFEGEARLKCREDRILMAPSMWEMAAEWWPRSVYFYQSLQENNTLHLSFGPGF